MVCSIFITPEADIDVDNFYLYLAQDNLKVANRFLGLLEQTYSFLTRHPEVAPKFPTHNPKLSDIPWFPVKKFPNHLVFYQYRHERIEIIRLFHKAQDIASILDESIR